MSALSGIGGGSLAAFSPTGSLPFTGAGNLTDYTSAYNAALAQNQALYSAILGGYGGLAATTTQNLNQVGSGYNQLNASVLGALGLGGAGGAVGQGGQIQGQALNPDGTINTAAWGIAGSAAQAIQQSYQQQLGQANQSLINSGLGNSTVEQSVGRGLGLGFQQALGGLGTSLAQSGAGYEANIGLAGLSSQQQAANTIAGIGGSALGFMNSVTAQYPSAGQYMDFAKYQGQMQALQNQQKLVNARAGQGLGGGGYAGAAAAPANPMANAAPFQPSTYSQQLAGAGSSVIPSYASPYGQSYAAQAAANSAGSGWNTGLPSTDFGIWSAINNGANDYQELSSSMSNGYDNTLDQGNDYSMSYDAGGGGGNF